MEIIVDESYAWVTVFGGFLMQFLIIGYLKSTGILMREFQAYFRCSNTLILLLSSLTFSLISLLAPVWSLVAQLVPLRWILVTSSLLLCMSFSLLFASFSMPLWIICIGLCTGACLSACYSSVICKVNECFERRRDLANGICFAGSSTGAVVMPLLFTFMTDRYSVASCCLLIGGYFLHLVIVGVLMPIRVVGAPTGGRPQPFAPSEALSIGSQISNTRLGELPGCPPQKEEQQPQQKRRSLAGVLTSLSTEQRWLTLVYVLATMQSNLGFTSQYIIFPMYLVEFSVSNVTTAVLVAVNGLFDLAARIATGWLSDRYQWRKSNIAILGMTSQGVVCVLCAFVSGQLTDASHRLVLFAAYAVLAGTAGGVYMGIVTSVLVSFVGIGNLSFMHSIVCCTWTLTTFPGQTMLGYFKDRTGTFTYSFAATGLFMISASIILPFERLVKRKTEEEQAMNGCKKVKGHQQCEQQGDPAVSDALMGKNGCQHA